MQEFYINKNSILPCLRLELIQDGRHDFNKFFEALQDSSITFTMTDVATGAVKIANAKATIQPKEHNNCVEEYIIQYNWRERDTKQPGTYRGQFNIKFNGNLSSDGVHYPLGNLIVPIREELYIYIMDGSIKK